MKLKKLRHYYIGTRTEQWYRTEIQKHTHIQSPDLYQRCQFNGERIINSINNDESIRYPFLKVNLNSNLMIHAKIYSKWIIDLNMKSKSIKILIEKLDECLPELGEDKGFLN